MPGEPLAPILTVDLYPEVRAALLDLLARLTPDEWRRQTLCCRGWTVKDMAAHLLGDDVGLLSRLRDGYSMPADADLSDWSALVAFINHLNDDWVRAARRISPPLLLMLLRETGAAVDALFRSRDLDQPWTVVNWAGSDLAPAWMEIARDYSEEWMHQQHIRDTVDRPGLKSTRYFAPVLDTFMRALPHTFRDTDALDGTHIRVIIPGEVGGTWSLLREGDAWALYRHAEEPAAAQVTLDAEDAWRLFTRGLDPDTAAQRARIEGDPGLASVVFQTLAIIA